ncbi:MAG: YchJ family metal-binding protein [Campylobacterota bacterium]|nr:YchJ family metal-binding protein [Campylobacterota bacterium]
MKIGANTKCPCGSNKKYKQCCQKLHKGASAKNALDLMRSRYSAFVASEYKYIINTTHHDNVDFTDNISIWKESILDFCNSTSFEKLNIIDFRDDTNEAYVTFEAIIFQNNMNITFTEKSKFLKSNSKWLYHSGEFL